MKKLLPLLLCAVILSASSFAQGQKTATATPATPAVPAVPSQKVIVEKTNGDKITGYFISGKTDSVRVQVSGYPVTIMLSDIASLKFVSASSIMQPPSDVPTIFLESAIVNSDGGTQSAARVRFYILNKSVEQILADAKVSRLSEGLSYLDSYALALMNKASAPKYMDIVTAGTQAIKPHIVGELETDSRGSAEYRFDKTGDFYIYGFTQTRKGHAAWNLPVRLQNGRNSIILDQNNAASAR